MGYALFTARKMSLQTRVNQLNARLMSISNQQDALTQQITNKQLTNGLRIASANCEAYEVFKNSSQSDSDLLELNSSLSNSELATQMSNFDIQALQSKVDVLDTARQSITTQLNAAQQELQQVEKAEESAIKNSTPKYVG